MLYVFPPDTIVLAICDYDRPYDDPLAVRCGDVVSAVTDGIKKTDILGWTWCVGQDGRTGWAPTSWLKPADDGWRLTRDFSALEFTVRRGDRLRALHSESGFLFCEARNGERAWVPDAVMALVPPS